MTNYLEHIGCADNNKRYDSKDDSQIEVAKKQKRKKYFFANVYVVSDTNTPENNGKVLVWKFGQKVYEKIMQKLKPEDEDEKSVDIFDFEKGANFKLKVKTVGGFPNYDNCKFADPAPLFTGDDADEKLKAVFDKIHDLAPFEAKENFKPYEELKERFMKVTGNESGENDVPAAAPKKEQPKKAEKKEEQEDEDTGGEEALDNFFDDLEK